MIIKQQSKLFVKLALLLALFVGAQGLSVSHFHIEDASPSHDYELCDLFSAQHNLQGAVNVSGISLPIAHAAPPVFFVKSFPLFLAEFPAYFLRAPPKIV